MSSLIHLAQKWHGIGRGQETANVETLIDDPSLRTDVHPPRLTNDTETETSAGVIVTAMTEGVTQSTIGPIDRNRESPKIWACGRRRGLNLE